jgi:hypothetical protein
VSRRWYEEEPLSVEREIVQARLRGLARNPAVPVEMLRRLVTDDPWRVRWCLIRRRVWTEEQFEALASHPDAEVRKVLAVAEHLDAEWRGRLVEDPDREVLRTLIRECRGRFGRVWG